MKKMKYKVTSEIICLNQIVNGITEVHGSNFPRTIEWLKTSEGNEFFSHDEAFQLKAYLDSKNNFTNNKITEATKEDLEPCLIDLAIFAKEVSDKKTTISDPIKIDQCPDLHDYLLNFEIEGHLNKIQLV